MPGQKPTRVQSRDQMVGFHGGGESGAERMLDELTRRTEAQSPRVTMVVVVDLVVGANRINHNLGRIPSHVTLCPSTADATFAWAVTSRDERQMVITVVGIAQTGATIEVK